MKRIFMIHSFFDLFFAYILPKSLLFFFFFYIFFYYSSPFFSFANSSPFFTSKKHRGYLLPLLYFS